MFSSLIKLFKKVLKESTFLIIAIQINSFNIYLKSLIHHPTDLISSSKGMVSMYKCGKKIYNFQFFISNSNFNFSFLFFHFQILLLSSFYSLLFISFKSLLHKQLRVIKGWPFEIYEIKDNSLLFVEEIEF